MDYLRVEANKKLIELVGEKMKLETRMYKLDVEIETIRQGLEPTESIRRWGEDIYPGRSYVCRPLHDFTQPDDYYGEVSLRGHPYKWSLCIVDDYGNLQIDNYWSLHHYCLDNEDENLLFYWGGMPGRCFNDMSQHDFDAVAERGCRFVDMRTGQLGDIIKGEPGDSVTVKYDDYPTSSWIGGYMGDMYCLII
jgi:hypothetical protein